MGKDRLVLVTNDDGVTSPGVIALADAASSVARVMVVAPDGERSAAGMGLTFHKPLRVREVKVGRWLCRAISGSPADSTMIAIHNFLPRKPDAVVSGINIGENLTVQDIFASGTVAAALQGALLGVPAMAFSMEVSDERRDEGLSVSDFRPGAAIAAEILAEVLERGLPEGVELLNVNFPWGTTKGTPVKITTPGSRKYKDYVLERKDPRGRPYYWLGGSRYPAYQKDTDVFAVHKERAISVSPLSVALAPRDSKEIRDFGSSLTSRIRRTTEHFTSKHK